MPLLFGLVAVRRGFFLAVIRFTFSEKIYIVTIVLIIKNLLQY